MQAQKKPRECQIAAALLILLISAVLSSVLPVTGASSGQAKATSMVTAQNSTSFSESQQTDDDVVRVGTNLVTIPARVMDRDGRYVTSREM
jgi:hypothetical protein